MMSKKKWDRFWKNSEFPMTTRLGFNSEKSSIRKLFNKLNLNKNARIIDFGCGEGRTLSYLRDFGFRKAIGVDSSEEALNACKKRGFVIFKDVFYSYFLPINADVLFSQGLLEHYLKKDWKPIIKDMVSTGAKTIVLMQPLTRSLTFRSIEFFEKYFTHFLDYINEYDYEMLDYMVAFDKFRYVLKFDKTTHGLPKFLDTSMFMVFERSDTK